MDQRLVHYVHHSFVSGSIESLCAFNFTAIEDCNKSYGWDFFDIQSEYLRMGAPSEYWTLTNLNKTYEVTSCFFFFSPIQ